LEAISVWLKRRIPVGEQRPQDLDVILGAHFVGELSEINLHSPADILPVLARVSELNWLGAFIAIRLRNPDSKDASVPERKDQVARSNLTH
jgi:hypothetical protein